MSQHSQRLALMATIFSLAVSVLGASQCKKRVKHGAGRRVDPTRSYTIPMSEVSGLTAFVDPETHQGVMAAVGDHGSDIAVIKVNQGDNPSVAILSLKSILKVFDDECRSKHHPACEGDERWDRQWEGIGRDGRNHWVILREQPPALIMIDEKGESVKGAVALNFETLSKLRPGQSFGADALGEGLVLLKNGHVLVAKENDPPVLIEFGPAGDAPFGLNSLSLLGSTDPFALGGAGEVTKYEPLQIWDVNIGNGCDLSELAIAANQSLYGMSDTCRRIYALKFPEAGEKSIKILESWGLGEGMKNPEGLVVLAEGFWVGTDKPEGDENLFWITRQTVEQSPSQHE